MTNKSKGKIVVKVGKGAKRPNSKPKKKPKPTMVGNLMRAGGAALGAYLGGPTGATLGRMAGGFVSRLTGQGDYKVTSNSLMQNNVFTFAKSSDGLLRMKRRELFGAVYSSTTFSSQSFALNPGLQTLLPWGSGVADLYEQYRLWGMVIEFVPTSGTFNGSNQALGAVYFATEYDPTRPGYANVEEMMASLFAQEIAPYQPNLHPIECKGSLDPFGNRRYLRSGSTTADLRFTDVGRFTVATQGQNSSGEQLGELWVTYDVEYFKPVFNGSATGDKRGSISGFTGVANTSWFGTTPTYAGKNYATAAVNRITFTESGNYLLTLKLQITGGLTVNKNLVASDFTAGSGASVDSANSGLFTDLPWSAPEVSVSNNIIVTTILVSSSTAGGYVDIPTGVWGGSPVWFGAWAIVTKFNKFSPTLTKPLFIPSQVELDREFQQLALLEFKRRILKTCSDSEDYEQQLPDTQITNVVAASSLGLDSRKLGPVPHARRPF